MFPIQGSHEHSEQRGAAQKTKQLLRCYTFLLGHLQDRGSLSASRHHNRVNGSLCLCLSVVCSLSVSVSLSFSLLTSALPPSLSEVARDICYGSNVVCPLAPKPQFPKVTELKSETFKRCLGSQGTCPVNGSVFLGETGLSGHWIRSPGTGLVTGVDLAPSACSDFLSHHTSLSGLLPLCAIHHVTT
jgi:hypothetical protein